MSEAPEGPASAEHDLPELDLADVDLDALLRRLGDHWRTNDAMISHLLRPGADPDRIRSAGAALGMELPDELIAWWAWHDGVDTIEGFPRDTATIGPGFLHYLTLDEAIARYHELRTTFPEGAEHTWPAAWLPVVAADADTVAVDCALAPDGPFAVHLVLETWDDADEPILEDFIEAIELWVDAFDRGLFVWDEDEGWWQHPKWNDLPPEMQASGIV